MIRTAHPIYFGW